MQHLWDRLEDPLQNDYQADYRQYGPNETHRKTPFIDGCSRHTRRGVSETAPCGFGCGA